MISNYERELERQHVERQRRLGILPPPGKQHPQPEPEPTAPMPPPTIRDWMDVRSPTAKITVMAIKAAVAKRFHIVPGEKLDSARRATNVTRPRQIACWLAHELTKCSMPDIGRRIGGRDHTTVLHAIRKITEQRTIDPTLDAELTHLVNALRTGVEVTPLRMPPRWRHGLLQLAG